MRVSEFIGGELVKAHTKETEYYIDNYTLIHDGKNLRWGIMYRTWKNTGKTRVMVCQILKEEND